MPETPPVLPDADTIKRMMDEAIKISPVRRESPSQQCTCCPVHPRYDIPYGGVLNHA